MAEFEVEFYDVKWKKRCLKLSGFSAQIVQHEIDHTNGIIIQNILWH